ncbi:MAG: hypothetical protein WB566_20070, partial [Terriglobales bacterium]
WQKGPDSLGEDTGDPRNSIYSVGTARSGGNPGIAQLCFEKARMMNTQIMNHEIAPGKRANDSSKGATLYRSRS